MPRRRLLSSTEPGVLPQVSSADDHEVVSSFQEEVLRVVLGTQAGEVLTYGQVAKLAGHPGAARAVGRALASSSGAPWWRVVAADGRLVPGLAAEQERQLRAEGLALVGRRVQASNLQARRFRSPSDRGCASPSPAIAPATPARPRRQPP
ncbi:MAG: MGMT family protein [Candidatus Dormibacteria bacterium]